MIAKSNAVVVSYVLLVCLAGSNQSDHQSRGACRGPYAERAAAGLSARTVPSSPFVPNLGQWPPGFDFAYSGGSMTLFLEERGWTIDLGRRKQKSPEAVGGSRAAVRMSFEGGRSQPRLTGEAPWMGVHNYLLGDDRSRWRTHVPLFESVHYAGVYDRIDVRMRESAGIPEYDLLLAPGADLDSVCVRVDGADVLEIDASGRLVVKTSLGSIVQPVPKTWETTVSGTRREVACRFVLLGENRYGFAAPDWNPATALTIDPGLVWASYVGGRSDDDCHDMSVDADGVVTIVGYTTSNAYPRTLGAYRSSNAQGEVFVSRFDPRRIAAASLVFSTFLGGASRDYGYGLEVGEHGVITLTGQTASRDFPTTNGSRVPGPTYQMFVSQLDPRKSGPSQLLYAAVHGGSRVDRGRSVTVAQGATIYVFGTTDSQDLPTSPGAFEANYSGGVRDAFVCRFDPSKSGPAQVVWSSYLGGVHRDEAGTIDVDAAGVVTVAGFTESPDFPSTPNAFNPGFGYGTYDGFISRFDPKQTGAAQLVYSTFLGSGGLDQVTDIEVSAGGLIITAVGGTSSTTFPTTTNGNDQSHNGGLDVFVARLDLRRRGSAQLVYSTFFGGSRNEIANGISIDAHGRIAIAGNTDSLDLPTTFGAHRPAKSKYYADGLVTLIDPRRPTGQQVVHATYVGGDASLDVLIDVGVSDFGVITAAGLTQSSDVRTTGHTFDATFNFGRDTLVVQVSAGVTLQPGLAELDIRNGGRLQLDVVAGAAHANRGYWILGSLGATPGTVLGGMRVPLNVDPYTQFTVTFANTRTLEGFRGTLDADGRGRAWLNLPSAIPGLQPIQIHHACVIFGPGGVIYGASQPTTLSLR